MKYEKDDLITIAKRDNNKKRPFLLVNPLQGKHLAVSPSKSIELFQTLAHQVFSHTDIDYANTLIIGFAETATAIGAGLAINAPFAISYIQTTREQYPEKEFLYFSEEHSHATDQMVIKDFLDETLKPGFHILFAEDEVTTGKTIENFIQVLQKTYSSYHLTFGIASILNGMGEEKLQQLRERNIMVDYLFAVPSYDYQSILDNYTYEPELRHIAAEVSIPYQTLLCDEYENTRLGVAAPAYQAACEHLAEQVMHQLPCNQNTPLDILILGTEECMYPGIALGAYIETHSNHQVRFHATTRSPILPSKEEDYPIRERYCLHSFYEQERTTYLYNVAACDLCIVVTDTPVTTTAMKELCSILKDKVKGNILLVNWR